MANARKLLIVDDDAELRDALLEQLGLHQEFEAVAVENGSKGVRFLLFGGHRCGSSASWHNSGSTANALRPTQLSPGGGARATAPLGIASSRATYVHSISAIRENGRKAKPRHRSRRWPLRRSVASTPCSRSNARLMARVPSNAALSGGNSVRHWSPIWNAGCASNVPSSRAAMKSPRRWSICSNAGPRAPASSTMGASACQTMQRNERCAGAELGQVSYSIR